MKKLTGLFAIFSLLLFVYICIPGFSNAQKLKSKAVDINKPGISRSVVKKQGLSSSIKSKLPALEVSRLALDSGCKITGFLQNKGSKMDAGHSDFNKIEIKVGYTFDGKTKEVLLKTSSGASADQPRLLISFPDMVNFTNGRPAKFTSKLQVPATGKGFATVFAEADPNNRIRETREGEQRKRIQKRLRSQCAPRLSPAVTVKVPTKKEKVNNVFTSRQVTPPTGVSTPQRTDHTYKDFGIKVTHPNSAIVRNNVTIRYQFSRSSSPPDKVSITLKGFCKKISNGRDGEFGIAHIYDGPPLESHRVNLSTIDFSSVGIEDICQGEVKYFFEVGEVREVGETSAGRAWGYSRGFTYLPYAIARPGSKSVKASEIKIDPDAKKKVNIPVPSKIHSDNMVTKERSPWVLSPTEGQHIARGESIPIEWVCPAPIITNGVAYKLLVFGPAENLIKEQGLENSCDGDCFSSEGGRIQIPRWKIPRWVLFYSSYIIQVEVINSGERVLIGQSGRFTMDGRWTSEEEDRETRGPRSDGIRITEPERGESLYIDRYTTINIQYELSIPDVPEDARIFFALIKTDVPDRILVEPIEMAPFDGRIDMTLDIIPQQGQYRIHVRVLDNEGYQLASGYSGVFGIVLRGYSGIEGGLEITQPSRGQAICAPGQEIVVKYNFGSCTSALDNATIKLSRRLHSGLYQHIDLYHGRLDADGEMSFPIPPQYIFGPTVFWQINIVACTSDSDDDCNPIVTGACRSTSDSFILDYCGGDR
jgi:hypothetical protein